VRKAVKAVCQRLDTGGQCRGLLEELLFVKFSKYPDMQIQQLLGDEDCLKGVLWVMGEQRRAWMELCGNGFVIHDNTYNVDNLGYNLGHFSGISQEGVTIPLGQCFILNKESESHEWQFRRWLEAHDGVAPILVITDSDPAVACVVAPSSPDSGTCCRTSPSTTGRHHVLEGL